MTISRGNLSSSNRRSYGGSSVGLIQASQPESGKPPAQHEAGRRCSSCDTILSIYNPTTTCSLHRKEILRWD